MLTSNGYLLDERPERLGRLRPVPQGERGCRDALLGRIERDGYAFLPDFLEPTLVSEFRRYYFEALAPTGLNESSTARSDLDRPMLRHVLFDEVVPGPEYNQFCRTPAILDWFS